MVLVNAEFIFESKNVNEPFEVQDPRAHPKTLVPELSSRCSWARVKLPPRSGRDGTRPRGGIQWCHGAACLPLLSLPNHCGKVNWHARDHRGAGACRRLTASLKCGVSMEHGVGRTARERVRSPRADSQDRSHSGQPPSGFIPQE